MAVDSGKTEKATTKKRKDERKKGNIFQSRDVANALSTLSIFMILKIVFPYIYKSISTIIVKFISYISTVDTISVRFASEVIWDACIAIILLTGPVLITAVSIGILSSGLQTGFSISKDNIKPKFSRINPIEGIKKMFTIRSIVELLKSILKLTVISVVLYTELKALSQNLTGLMFKDLLQSISTILDTIIDVVLKLSLTFIGIAVIDYGYQKWQYERNIRMSKQEIKEEYKQLEGDPQIKGQIKERQRKMSMQRMMQKVPTADVIIRNPTHFAIALSYNMKKNAAPIVVAKGQDFIALKIIEIAEQYNIPMTENKLLARELYARVKIGREIPAEYYNILAEIMAWVYSLRKGNHNIENNK